MCEKSSIWGDVLSQFITLVTFFAFPAIQFIIVKRFSRKQGLPELWYLPAYGFRLVVRNIPNKRALSEIKAKTILRQIVPPSSYSSVSTYKDDLLADSEDFFLLPQEDKILLSFKIEGNFETELQFIQTDKIGNKKMCIALNKFDEIISDYSANVENLLNFDIKIMKRALITKANLIQCWNKIRKSNTEQLLTNIETINIG